VNDAGRSAELAIDRAAIRLERAVRQRLSALWMMDPACMLAKVPEARHVSEGGHAAQVPSLADASGFPRASGHPTAPRLQPFPTWP
jgi:hypothetical protein